MDKIIKNSLLLSIDQFQNNLLYWYQKNARPLPWRGNKNPYHIWISEIMLQQTRVNTVKKYFPAFIEMFPTIHDLATSEIKEVLRCWQGLGYYRRALNIHKAARIIDKDYQGYFPTDYQKILSLPGIGEYTSGAIVSIAFNQALPAIDGNIKRVISRIFFLTEDINQTKAANKIKRIMKQIISEQHPGEFNQALMEIGATLCSPKKPNCQQCPIKNNCSAVSKTKQELLPIKSKKKKPKIFNMEIAIVKNQNKLLLVKRSSNTILADMWGLPIIESKSQYPDGNDIRNWIAEQLNIKVIGKTFFIKKLSHVFTHQIWRIDLYLFHVKEYYHLPEAYTCWVNKDELCDFPIPQAFKKCLKEYFDLFLV